MAAMTTRNKHIVIAGGGTGGHVFPALAIAEGLVENGVDASDITFFGSKRSIEKDVVPAAGFSIVTFPGRGLNRKDYLRNIINVFAILGACLKATVLFIRHRPRIVIGVGGYASVPALFAATLLGIDRVIHEQNAYMGRTNRMAQKMGAKVLTTREVTKGARTTSTYVGLPLRSGIENARDARISFLTSHRDRPMVLIAGGSLGSRVINDAVVDMVTTFSKSKYGFPYNIVHICGPAHYEELRKKYDSLGLSDTIILHSFRDDIVTLYARSDVVVSRAGAGTCVELETLGVKCILIPLPSAPGDHQRLNAGHIVESHLGVILDQNKLSGEKLTESLVEILESDAVIDPYTYHLEAQRRIARYIINTFLT